MTTFYSLNRAFLRLPRPDFHWFLFTVIFPILWGNILFPGANTFIIQIKDLWDNFYKENKDRHTIAADAVYENILNKTVELMNYCVTAAANNLITLSLCGFTINKTTKTSEPQTSIPINIKKMILGAGKFMLQAETDQWCHQLIARTRKMGSTEADWRIFEISQTEKIYFEGYAHGVEYEVQLCAQGTAGRSEWSESIFVLVD